MDFIQRVQSKILRSVTVAPWYIWNENIHRHLGIHAVKEEIDKQKASFYEKLSAHPNPLERDLTRVSNLARLQRTKDTSIIILVSLNVPVQPRHNLWEPILQL